ncbi:MAG: rhodanese-like domain-containing protein [Bacilli bacterium]|nr:rhodanese-like domain-containing protein [Bacilli bacterium]
MNITVEELLKLSNINIIDLRSNQSYNNNHIKGAVNIPYNSLISNPNKYLDRTKKYYIYCQKGITSKKACNYLLSIGFNVSNIIGGYEEWILKS